jgi:hypothetical protein
MTTTLQTPLPGSCHFPSSFTDLSSCPSLPFLDDSTPSGYPPQQKTPGPNLHYDKSFPDSRLSTTQSSPQLSCSNTSYQGSSSSTPAISFASHIRYNIDEDDDFAFPSYKASGLPAKPVRMSLSSQKQDAHPTPMSAPSHWDRHAPVQDSSG